MANERRIYFGTKERMVWVRAPQVDYDASKIGWEGGTTQFLNGGAYVRRSTTAHKQYNFTWTNLSRDEIRLINDFADGVYGDGPIYFIDPFAADKNVLPQYWATPRLVFKDAPVLSGQDRNGFIQYPIALNNSLGYPTAAPQYVWDTSWPAAILRPTLYIPVPTGYTLWFGAHGYATSASTSALNATPDSDVPAQLEILDVNNQQTFNYSWDGSSTLTGVTFNFGATASPASAIISGMVAQVLPTGVTPTANGFISGQGNGGVRFATQPQRQDYSAARDMVSLTAQLVETV
jgi:hypothetical protein